MCVVVVGEVFSASSVLSRVPQGSVIEPCTSNVTSLNTYNVLYADDMLLYKYISCHKDVKAIQSDIVVVEQWSTNRTISSSTPRNVSTVYMAIPRKKSSTYIVHLH